MWKPKALLGTTEIRYLSPISLIDKLIGKLIDKLIDKLMHEFN